MHAKEDMQKNSEFATHLDPGRSKSETVFIRVQSPSTADSTTIDDVFESRNER